MGSASETNKKCGSPTKAVRTYEGVTFIKVILIITL